MRYWRAALRCLAAVMFLTAAGMPVRHAPQAAAAGSGVFLVEVCSADGSSRWAAVEDDPAGHTGEHESAAAPCLLCHALPGVAVPCAPIAPSLDRLAVAPDLSREDCAPRAPPPGHARIHPPTAPPAFGV